MSDLSQFISRVLESRQRQLPLVAQVRQGLDVLVKESRHLLLLANEISTQADSPAHLQQTCCTLASNLEASLGLVPKLGETVARLESRFGKRTIDIGVAGKIGQGKSTLLCAISGLPPEVIPTSSGEPCTGAKSRLFHRENDAFAEIEFYSEGEFLRDIVHSYYEHLGESQRPQTLEAFRNSAPPEVRQNQPGLYAVAQKLESLRNTLQHVVPHLGQGRKRIPIDDVWNWVAQRDRLERPLVQYLAVKCATIYVRFPNGDVTGLSLVDLPGLGELAKGHGQKLVHSLQNEVDVVIVIKRPDSFRDTWGEEDIRVFDVIKAAVPEVELSDWLFILLNRLEDGKNADITQRLKSQVPKLGCSPRVLEAACNDPCEVHRAVFGPILEHLQDHLERIDQQFWNILTEGVIGITDAVRAALSNAKDAFSTKAIEGSVHERFKAHLSEFEAELKKNLYQLVEEYRPDDKSGTSCAKVAESFAEAISRICSEAEAAPKVSSEELLIKQNYRKGGWNAVVQKEFHLVRSHLTSFLSDRIDEYLGQVFAGLLDRVYARAIPRTVHQMLPQEVQSSPNPRERLRAVAALLNPGKQPILYHCLEYLLEFSYTYKSHLHARVRRELEQLDPERINFSDRFIPDQQRGPDLAAVIRRGITEHYRAVVFEIRERLADLSIDMQDAAVALVGEVRDRLAWTDGVMDEWDQFLFLHRGDAWPEEFSRFEAITSRSEQWQDAVGRVDKVCEVLRGIARVR